MIKGLKKDYIRYAKKLITLLRRILQGYSEEEKLTQYCKHWISDCFVLLGEYKKALDIFPKPKVDKKSMYPTEKILNLKLITNDRIFGYDILTLNGPKVTQFGKKHLASVSDFLDIIVKQKEKIEKKNILKEWKKIVMNQWVEKKDGILKKSEKWGGDPNGMLHGLYYPIFVGSFCSYQLHWLTFYRFSDSKIISKTIEDMTKEAENTFREEKGIPKIGEGWISETELYYKIKKYFQNLDVMQHARPVWLKPQHLDILIPSLNVALEYQGSQHYRPVNYFGGVKAYKSIRKRDLRKKRKCIMKGIKLIYVKEGYRFDEIIKEIKN